MLADFARSAASRSGPDTGGKKLLIPSAEQWAPKLLPPSRWRLAVYRTLPGLTATPDFKGKDVSIVGYALTPFVDLQNLNDFRKARPCVRLGGDGRFLTRL